MSPFDIHFGWISHFSLDQLGKYNSSNDSVCQLPACLRSSFLDATFAHCFAQVRQAANNEKRYSPPSYKVGKEVCFSGKYFSDSSSAVQKSRKLSVCHFGPFCVLALVGKNSVRLLILSNITIHPGIHVEHVSRVQIQCSEISTPLPVREDVLQDGGSTLVVVIEILGHRRCGVVYHWLTPVRETPLHEARGQLTRDFIDDDGTITAAFLAYIKENNLLPHLYN